MMKPYTGLQTYTDLCLFYSAVQCYLQVIQRDGYVLLDCEDAAERACCCGGLKVCSPLLTTLFGLLRHNSLRWRFLMCLCISHFFGKATPSLSKKKKKNNLFGFTMTSVHKMRKKKKHSRAEVESVPSAERVTKIE